MTNIPTINAVWIGNRLTRLHQACLASFVRHGRKTVLHVFEDVENVPDGVDVIDANQPVNRSDSLTYKNGSFAAASDYYRLRILRENLGLYIDCDLMEQETGARKQAAWHHKVHYQIQY